MISKDFYITAVQIGGSSYNSKLNYYILLISLRLVTIEHNQ